MSEQLKTSIISLLTTLIAIFGGVLVNNHVVSLDVLNSVSHQIPGVVGGIGVVVTFAVTIYKAWPRSTATKIALAAETSAVHKIVVPQAVIDASPKLARDPAVTPAPYS